MTKKELKTTTIKTIRLNMECGVDMNQVSKANGNNHNYTKQYYDMNIGILIFAYNNLNLFTHKEFDEILKDLVDWYVKHI
jgi:hypothetical protein